MDLNFNGKFVSSENESFISILYPEYSLENEFNPFRSKPSIYTGKTNPSVIQKLRHRGSPFIIFVRTGGEISLTREKLFELCSKRKRNLPSDLRFMPLNDFLNTMRIMNICNIFLRDDNELKIFDVFELIVKKSLMSLSMALSLARTHGDHKVLFSLITFFQRVSSKNDNFVSPRYTLLLNRAGKNKVKYIQALIKLPMYNNLSDKMKIIFLIKQVV